MALTMSCKVVGPPEGSDVCRPGSCVPALGVSPAALCPLVDIPCALQAQRRRERLAGR